MTTPRRLRRPEAKRRESERLFLSSLHQTWSPSAVSIRADGKHYATTAPGYHECEIGEWRQMCHCGKTMHGRSQSEVVLSMLDHVIGAST